MSVACLYFIAKCSTFSTGVILQVVMMETSGWLEVQTSLKVDWSSVTVVCGALSVAIGGEHLMPVWPAVS